MAYDEALAEQVRVLLGDASDVTEKRMFGGLAFLLGGNMAVALGTDGMLVRTPPEHRTELLREPGARPAVMGRREMSGWLEIEHGVLIEHEALAAWVARGRGVAQSLPPK